MGEGSGGAIVPRGVGGTGEATTPGSSRGGADSWGVRLGELSLAIWAEGSGVCSDAVAPGEV